MTGPIPKRDAERRRRNKPAVETTTVDLDTLIAGEIEVPVVDEEWHPIAQHIFTAAQASGQSIFYEPSDWAALLLLCEQVSRSLAPQPVVVGSGEEARVEMHTVPVNGAVMGQINKAMASLMLLEGDRRKLRIELERKRQRDAMLEAGSNVVSITQTREAAFAKAKQQG